MKNRYILYIVALVALLSCEKELDISVLNGKGGALTISAIAVPDSAFNISLTRVYDIDKVPVKVMKTFLLLDVGEYHYGNPGNGGEEWTYNSIMDKFEFDSLGNASQAYREYAIMDAKVSAVVNGKDKYEFSFNDNNCLYESEYVPKEGDNITVYAEGYTDSTRVSYERALS